MLEPLRQIGLGASPVAASERRSAWRVTRRIGLLGFRANGEKLELLATNFGPGGLRVGAPRCLSKDEALNIKIARPKEDKRQSLDPEHELIPVKVVWCRRRKDYPVFEVGMRFAGDNSATARAAARFLLEDCGVSVKAEKEKRKAPRANVEQITGVLGRADGSMMDIQVLDLSVGGALLLVQKELQQGEKVSVKIVLSRDMPGLDCKGTVIRSSAAGGSKSKNYEIGVSFDEVAKDHRERLIQYLSKLLRNLSPS